MTIKKLPEALEGLKTRFILSVELLKMNFTPNYFDRLVRLAHSDDPDVIYIRDIAQKNIFRGGMIGFGVGVIISNRIKNVTSKIFMIFGSTIFGGIVGGGIIFVFPQPEVVSYFQQVEEKNFIELANELSDLDPRFQKFLCSITNSIIQVPVLAGQHYYEREKLLEYITKWTQDREAEVQKRNEGRPYDSNLCKQLENKKYWNSPAMDCRLTIDEVTHFSYSLNYLPAFKSLVEKVFIEETTNKTYPELFKKVKQAIETLNSTREQYIQRLRTIADQCYREGRITEENYKELLSNLTEMQSEVA